MTVAVLTPSVSRNGAGLYDAVQRLAMEQAAHSGFTVRIFGLEDSNTLADLPAWRGLPVTTAAPRGPRSFGYAPELLGALRVAQPEILHQHGLWMYPSVACRRWAAQTRKPYILSPHGMLDPWAVRNSAWKKRLAGWLYENRHLRHAACLHALNQSEARSLRAYGLRNPICVIPNGVELPEQTPTAGGHDKLCVFLGRLHPKKGLPALLRAWAGIPVTDWKLVVAGWDQCGHERELRRLAASLGLEKSVQFVGPKFGAEKAALLRGASAFVLPSLSEGLPVAVLEAWSYGLPVAMTPQCNLPEGFEEEAAVRMEPNEDGIAFGLRRLFAIQDEGLRAMGARGRRLVEQRFTWPQIATDMLEVYGWVLGCRPRPECVQLT